MAVRAEPCTRARKPRHVATLLVRCVEDYESDPLPRLCLAAVDPTVDLKKLAPARPQLAIEAHVCGQPLGHAPNLYHAPCMRTTVSKRCNDAVARGGSVWTGSVCKPWLPTGLMSPPLRLMKRCFDGSQRARTPSYFSRETNPLRFSVARTSSPVP